MRRVHGAVLGYQPFRMKPVHFATSFLLALTGRYYRLEYLNKASVPKTAPRDGRNIQDEYPSDRLHPLLIKRGTLDPSVDLEAFRTLRAHLRHWRPVLSRLEHENDFARKPVHFATSFRRPGAALALTGRYYRAGVPEQGVGAEDGAQGRAKYSRRVSVRPASSVADKTRHFGSVGRPGGVPHAACAPEALAAWILSRLEHENDFAREGLPEFDIPCLLEALSAGGLPAGGFSLALVGFDTTQEGLRAVAEARGLGGLAGLTLDLHVATEWRNDHERHPRIVALARGYNPSVHGLRFFSRASSGELAAILLGWAENESEFTTTPQHRVLLERLREARGLRSIRSLEGVAAFLAAWSEDGDGTIGRPRDVLPALGLLRDPRLFEADDLAKRLEHNLRVGERVTIMSPGDIRQRRERATRYSNAATAEWVSGALDRLEAYRRGRPDAGLTLEDAEQIVTLPPDRPGPPGREPDDLDVDDEPDDEGDDTEEKEDEPDLHDMAVDALLEGREEDLVAIGEALEAAWEEFEQNGDRLASNQETSQGVARLDEPVDPKIIDWVTAFCDTDRFGGFMEVDVADLPQALARHAEFDPVFLDPEAVWNHDGVAYSIEALLKAWDGVDAVAEACRRPIAEMWRDFVAARASLADRVRPLLIHPREWLDTHPETRESCERYLAVATELYGAVQKNYRAVWDESREWAQATLDAILALDLVQVRMAGPDGGVSAKAVMLPLHPLHLWRYQRFGEILRDLSHAGPMSESDRKVVIEELRRPERFVGVIRTGATPEGRGLNQLLPVANRICGLATFENLHNAISSADGMETLVLALDHFVMLYPNHPRPLRLTLVKPEDMPADAGGPAGLLVEAAEGDRRQGRRAGHSVARQRLAHGGRQQADASGEIP